MINNEKRAVFSLALIMAFRMLGMFMILPVFSLYANQLQHATPLLIGFALGIYGLSQALLQLPLGSLSDKIGRKKVITFGLCLFALGSLVAALSHSIYGIILGRGLQGAGAVGSTILAMTADLTRDENRSKAMAMIGLTIGLSFSIALILGPLLNHYFHLPGIFWATFGLSLLALIFLHTIVPNPPTLAASSAVSYNSAQLTNVLKNPQLLRLNFGIFSLHAILTATFIAAPLLLTHKMQLSQFDQVVLYLVVLLFAFILMLPFIIIAEKKRKIKPIFLSSIATLVICELGFLLSNATLAKTVVLFLLFFTAFTLLEATLPSLVSKIAPLQRKGTAMGIYSSAQFLGIFCGGSLGGVLFAHFHLTGLFLFCALLGFIWLTIAFSMAQPPYLSTCIFPIQDSTMKKLNQLKQQLTQLDGVAEIAAVPAEGLLYVKADQKIITKDQLRNAIDEGNLQQ